MFDLKKYEFWFIVGGQDLYGEETLRQVEANAKVMAAEFAKDRLLPGTIVLKGIAINPQSIRKFFAEANAAENCAGIITWMHTFSPSKMWIQGLAINHKPILHLHTQFNRDIPWDSIDMDFMNLNQAAHGDREHGHIYARMRINRKIVAGHWQNEDVRRRMGVWMRVAAAKLDGMNSVVVRFGDNMREVAVTEGDKVEAQRKFGWQINTWGIGDLIARYNNVSDDEAEKLIQSIESKYEFAANVAKGGEFRHSLVEQVRMEIAIKQFLEAEHAGAYTDTFQDLQGLPQLPGFASQRLMEQGYGFGGEGDWKQSMLLHSAKVMASGLPGGTSFMEDYTYHFAPGNEAALGAHMLEVCPSIADGKPRIEVHPLGIGGKAAPARLVFDAAPGPAVLATIIDMGNRFRMILNDIETIKIEKDMPKLPVARALWKPYPSLAGAAESWILSGGTHHAVYSTQLTSEYFKDWAEMMDIECIHIGKDTCPDRLRNELRWGEAYWNTKV